MSTIFFTKDIMDTIVRVSEDVRVNINTKKEDIDRVSKIYNLMYEHNQVMLLKTMNLKSIPKDKSMFLIDKEIKEDE